jgi:N-acetylglucosamine kinase-like BadF-type ATPase
MKKQWLLGLDATQAIVHFTIIDESSNIVEHGSFVGDIERLDIDDWANAAAAFFSNLPLMGTIRRVSICLPWRSSKTVAKQLCNRWKELIFFSKALEISVIEPAMAHLLSGHGRPEGIVISLSTAAFCFGATPTSAVLCGGYEPLEGYGGSAYMIGLESLRHLAKVRDGRVPSSPFSEAIFRHIEVDYDRYMTYAEPNPTKEQVAQLAKIVVTFGMIDHYAYKILADAADEVRLLVETVHRRLDYPSTELVITGLLSIDDSLFLELVVQNARKVASFTTIDKPSMNISNALAHYALTQTKQSTSGGSQDDSN